VNVWIIPLLQHSHPRAGQGSHSTTLDVQEVLVPGWSCGVQEVLVPGWSWGVLQHNVTWRHTNCDRITS
jgi:hypothetical protein